MNNLHIQVSCFRIQNHLGMEKKRMIICSKNKKDDFETMIKQSIIKHVQIIVHSDSIINTGQNASYHTMHTNETEKYHFINTYT